MEYGTGLWTSQFTFQYASIKPTFGAVYHDVYTSFTFQYASIKPNLNQLMLLEQYSFTFQYASIKPVNLIDENEEGEEDLHFNMLLLNQIRDTLYDIIRTIYISICFY